MYVASAKGTDYMMFKITSTFILVSLWNALLSHKNIVYNECSVQATVSDEAKSW